MFMIPGKSLKKFFGMKLRGATAQDVGVYKSSRILKSI